ncbi:hypothetical protein C8A03DRAFT_32941 [Achaetomium macrosporum]|uniref:Uncharacterized protein n=1 Tax=Achaetomium macrosporum TaxID=79813 RepID=A0AAN7CDJ4_9PEZI|nr:hypothetical protein C8A03DRAFT_32941 [Achaetomium macrosporum]
MSATADNDLSASLLSSSKATDPPRQSNNPTTGAKNCATADPSKSGAAAERAMAWKPALDRRQSWSSQEWKHDVQTRQYVLGRGAGGGFSEA